MSGFNSEFHFRLNSNTGPAVIVAGVFYALVCVLFVIVSSFNDNEPQLIYLQVGSGISLLLFWRCISWGKGRYDTFGASLLIIYAIFKLHSAIDTMVYGPRIDEIYPAVPLPDNLPLLFLKSEGLNHFGILLLVSVWRSVIGQKIEQFSFLNNYHYHDINKAIASPGLCSCDRPCTSTASGWG